VPGDLRPALAAGLRAAGLEPGPVDVDDLAGLDELHALGRRGTFALATLAGIARGERVLDVGAGLGGPARLLASAFGADVTACDRSPELCDAAVFLNEATRLTGFVRVVRGDALALPFADGSFDLVWTQHVQMNVADKPRLAAELARVLRPGGRLAFQDVLAGPRQPIRLPVPWADDAGESALATPDEWRAALAGAGLRLDAYEDQTAAAARFYARAAERPPRPLGAHLVVPDLPRKVRNMARNLAEDRLRVAQGVCARAGRLGACASPP
jgi:SAM-dependent methyltransferase